MNLLIIRQNFPRQYSCDNILVNIHLQYCWKEVNIFHVNNSKRSDSSKFSSIRILRCTVFANCGYFLFSVK